ncbi:SDR family oxidoreductase [Reinekea blandensis]|uniref:NAD-dependent epimerase/dehydratase n=1 Tax=Reinekea blandensis MED297 TaxID=314283 RepID=A4BA72_9GAMM|nr:SDR family oxidoreductase [Reinekea blandensis]EAR10828.1 NAD-dependent epimerase/dehydratase [Reinekea sp. MED297] [Reinekea blandensis MED297]
MQRVFITGATGFLGTNLVRQLIAADVEVHALKRQTSDTRELDNLPVHWHIGDVTHHQSLLAACPENMDVFFHAAADTSMWKRKNTTQNRINLTGTDNAIAVAIERRAKRFVHTSSIAAYGVHDTLITEATEQLGEQSFCNYYRTKHLSEKAVKKAVAEQQLDAVILNPCHLVGAPDHHNWSQMIDMVDKDRLPGVPPGLGSFCDIKEVARAHLLAAEQGRTGENYILSGKDLSFVAFVSEIGQMLGKKTPKRATPAWVLKTFAQLSVLGANVTGREPELTPEKALIVCDQLQVSSAKAQQELGYRADTDVQSALRDCYDWMQSLS